MGVPPAPDRLLPLSRLIEILEQAGPSSPVYAGAAQVLDARLLPDRPSIPEATPPGAERFLTIGMATYDDYDGVYFSVQAIRLYHPEVTSQTEILVIDNHPEGPCAAALKKLESQVEGYRYVPCNSHRGTAVRDLLFRESNAPWVLASDSHVQFAPGALARLAAFLAERPESNDLWQGPLLSDDLKGLSSHFDPVWSAGMYGQWALDLRAADCNAPPFEIGMQGLGVFACRKAAWPGFNPRFSGFGGEEGYLHDKIRQRGGRVFCLPFLRWTHRFNRPLGIPYRPVWRERIRNYLLGQAELGLDGRPVEAHFESFLGAGAARPLIEAAKSEIESPFHYFDAIYSIRRGDSPERWTALNLDRKIRFLPAPESPVSSEIGRVLAHRNILEEAERQKLANVLVLDEEFEPSPDTLEPFRDVVDPLRAEPWRIHRLPAGTAYHASIFRRVIAELPAAPSAIALWLRRGNSLDFLQTRVREGCQPPAGGFTGFGISLFGFPIAVLSDCRAAEAILRLYLLPWLPRAKPDLETAGLVLRVLRNREPESRGFAAYAGDRLLAADDRMNAIIEVLQAQIDETAVRTLPNLVPIHAGVIAWNGTAALLPAGSGAGKTTLVAELLRKGAVYSSDEYALLDAEGRVHPYPRALMLRSEGGWWTPALPSAWNAATSEAPSPVRLIVGVERAQGAQWNVRRISQSEALVVLLRNTPREMAQSPEMLAPLQAAVGSAACYRGVRGEAAEAADRIIELLSSLA
jgi:hypothetical protein